MTRTDDADGWQSVFSEHEVADLRLRAGNQASDLVLSRLDDGIANFW